MRRRKEINDPALERARKEFQAWRKGRKRLGPIPESLWRPAVALAKKYGASRISEELRVGYQRLRERLKATKKASTPKPRRTPCSPARRFVEVTVPPMPVSAGDECVVELHNARGERLVIRMQGRVSGEIMSALGRVFLGQADT